MSVYKEGYYTIGLIEANVGKIFYNRDVYGAPTREDDTLWEQAAMLIEMYGDKTTRVEQRGVMVKCEFTLIDEHRTGKTETFLLEYQKCTSGLCNRYNGFLRIEKLN